MGLLSWFLSEDVCCWHIGRVIISVLILCTASLLNVFISLRFMMECIMYRII